MRHHAKGGVQPEKDGDTSPFAQGHFPFHPQKNLISVVCASGRRRANFPPRTHRRLGGGGPAVGRSEPTVILPSPSGGFPHRRPLIWPTRSHRTRRSLHSGRQIARALVWSYRLRESSGAPPLFNPKCSTGCGVESMRVEGPAPPSILKRFRTAFW